MVEVIPEYKPTIETTYEPAPLDQGPILGEERENIINPTVEAWRKAVRTRKKVKTTSLAQGASEDYAFAAAEQELQQYIASPVNTVKMVAREAAKVGIGVGAMTHAQMIGSLLKVHPALAAAGGAALLFGEPFYNQLRQYEYELQSWSHPEYILKHNVDSQLKNALLRTALPVFSKPLVALGHGLGLVDFEEMPSYLDPSVPVNTAVFKPTRWLNKKPAEIFERMAEKRIARLGNKDALATGLNRYSHALKNRKRHSTLGWLLYPLTLIFGVGAEAILAYVEARAPQLASLLRGYAGSGLRAIPSLNTVMSGWGTSALVDSINPALNPRISFLGNLPAAGLAGGFGGWYYQTLLNMANNTHAMQLDIFKSLRLPSASALRFEIMPRYYESIYGAKYWNNGFAIDRFVKDFGYKVPGTQWRGQVGMAQYQFLEAKNWSNSGFLNRVFSKPAQFLFKHRILQAIPLRGFMLGPMLGLPLFGREHLLLMAADAGLKILGTNPILNRIKNSALWGAAVGAEIGYLTGQNLITSALIGAGTGIGIQGLNLLASWEISAQSVGGRYVYNPSSQPDFDRKVTLYRPGEGPTANFWDVVNRGDYLTDRLPGWANNNFTRGLLTKLNGESGAWVKNLRFLNGSWTGALIGAQIFALTGNPLWIAAGVGAGIGAQFGWERYLANLAAKGSSAFARVVAGTGKYVLGPIGAALNIFSAASSFGDFLGKPSWGGAAWTVGLSGLAVSGLVFLGVALPVALLVVAGSLLIEGVARILGYSITGWLNQNIIRPVFDWLGKAIGSVAGGALNFLSQAANAVIGFAMGILQAIMAGDIPGPIAGLTTAAVSIGMVGTTIVTMIAGGAFFTSASNFIQQTAAGVAYLRAEKEVSVPSPANITTATYTLSYSYPSARTDDKGNPITDPLTNVSLTDTFVSPINFKTTDFDIISSSVPAREVAPSSIVFSNLPPLKPGDSNTITLTVNFREPLDKLLASNIYNASNLCNRGELKTNGPQRYTNNTCINVSGGIVGQDAVTAANNLEEILKACYSQTCDPGVTKKDFQVPNDYDPANCPNPLGDEIQGCKTLYEQNLGILEAAINKVSESAIANNVLTPEGFVNAVAAQLNRRDFVFNQTCTNYYQPVEHGQALAGDIITNNQGVVGIATQISFGQVKVITVDRQGRMQTVNSSINLVGQILHYNPNYATCP